METIMTPQEARNHPHLLCRLRFRIHGWTHRYANYELTPPDGSPPIIVVTYAPRLPWAKWTCWINPDGTWEKHTPQTFTVRMHELIELHKKKA